MPDSIEADHFPRRFPHAIEFARGANEKLTMGGDDGRSNHLSVRGIVHAGRMNHFTVGRVEDGHLSHEIDQVNFTVGRQRRSFILFPARRWYRPLDFTGFGFHAGQASPHVAEDKEIPIVIGRRGHIRGDVAGLTAHPGQGALVEDAGPAGFDGINGIALGSTGEKDAVAGNRRGDQARMFDLVRVPGAPAPQLLAGLRVVPGQDVAANNEHLVAAVVAGRNRRGEGFRDSATASLGRTRQRVLPVSGSTASR